MKSHNKYINHAGLILKRIKNNLNNRAISKKGGSVSLTPELVDEYNQNRYYGTQKYICLAPFNSMFLSINGNVYACNLNRKFVLGNIKSQSLSQIWNGKKTEKLRAYISSKDLNHGCEKCLFNISSKNFDASTSSHYDYVGYDAKSKYPLRIDFEISNICNLGCIMCSSTFSSTIQKEIKGKKLTKSHYNSSLLPDLKEFIPHIRFMNFSGGEPFMNNLYFDIWEQVALLNKDCRVHIQTNGTVFNEKVERILNIHAFNIGISIDSLQKETYDKIRLFSDFEKRQLILKKLTDYCHRNKTTLTYSFCLLKLNAFEIPDFVTLANQNNAVLYLSPVFEPYEEAIWNLPVPELERLKEYCRSFTFTSKNDIHTKNIIHFNQFVQQIDIWIEKQEKKAAFLSESKLTDAEVSDKIKLKLKNYFDNFRQINGAPCEDEAECLAYLDNLSKGHPEIKPDLLKNLLFESEERIYNQIKYYWL